MKVIGASKRYLKLIGNPKDRARSCSTARRARSRRTACSSTAPTRSRSTASRPQLQGQRLLRRQRHRLHDQPPDRDARPASTASTPSTPSAARSATPRPTTTTTRASTSGRRRRRTKPVRSIVATSTSLGQRPRLVGHQHALRDDHEVSSFYNNGVGHRAQRAGLGEVPAAGGQRDHRTTTSSGTTSTTTRAPAVQASRRPRRRRTRRHRHPAVRRPPQPGREQPDLRQLPRRRRRDPAASCSRSSPDARRPESATRSTNNQFGLGGTDLNGHDMFYDGNGIGQLLRAQRRAHAAFALPLSRATDSK